MRKLAIVLGITTSLGLGTSAHAQHTPSVIQASFDRDSQRQAPATTPVGQATRTPLQVLFTNALRTQSDPIHSAFRRDLYRFPAAIYASAIPAERDPLVEAIRTALWGNADLVLTSFARDLYRTATPTAANLVDRTDSVQILFNNILQQQANTSLLARTAIAPPRPVESATN